MSNSGCPIRNMMMIMMLLVVSSAKKSFVSILQLSSPCPMCFPFPGLSFFLEYFFYD